MSAGGRLAALTSALGATALVAGGVVLGAHPAAPAAAVAARSVQVPAGPTALVCPGPPQALSQGAAASRTTTSTSSTSSTSSGAARGVQLTAASASLTATALTGDEGAGDATGSGSGSGSSSAPAPTSATPLGSLLSVAVPGEDGGLLSAAPVAGRPAVVAGASTALATTGVQRGLSTPPCRAPSPDAWLVGGTAGAGHALSLVLADASSTATTVDVTVLTARGPLQPAALQGLSVGPGQQRSLVLAGVVPASGPLALRVRSSGAGVAAWLDEQVVDGLVAGGTDVVVPSAAPARHAVVTGVLAGAGQSPPVLRLADPGTAPLVARYSVASAPTTSAPVAGAGTSGASGSGTGASAAVAVPAGGVVEVPLRGLAPGASAVTVDAGAPVLASVRLDTSPTTTAADAAEPATTPAPTATTPAPTPAASTAASAAARSSGDLAWATASAPVTAPTLVALPPATSSSSSAVLDDQLVVTAAGASAATLDVRVVDAAGTPGPSRRLVVPAGTTLGADVAGLAAQSSSSAPVALLLAPVGGSPVTAALVTARTATTSGAATGAGQDPGTGVGDLLSVAAVSPPGPVAGRLRVQLASTP